MAFSKSGVRRACVHYDALRFLHWGMRAKLVPKSNLTMVHFDSHPDLSSESTMQANLCFEPELLYPRMHNVHHFGTVI